MDKKQLLHIINECIKQYLRESGLPPGMENIDDVSLDDFINRRSIEEDKGSEHFGASTKPLDIAKLQKIATDREAKEKDLKKPVAARDSKLIHKNLIVDKESGNLWSPNKLKSLIMQRPTSLLGENEKMQKSGGDRFRFFDTTLPAFRGLYVDENSSDKELRVVTTCPNAADCVIYCYAGLGGYIQYEATGLSASRKINFLLNDWNGYKNLLISEIQARFKTEARGKNGKIVVIRWHDAGDFFSPVYLEIAYEIARLTPNVIHYAYTKEVDMVRKSKKPKNFTFNYSFGGRSDKTIDRKKEKFADVVPLEVFYDLTVGGKSHKIDSSKSKELKKRIALAYQLDPGSVITYDELMKIPYDPNKSYTPKYNVIIWPGNGDDSAMRKDVLGTYLLIH